MAERQRLLGLVIERIVVIPLEAEIPVNQYRVSLRHDLRIQWKSEVASSEEIVVLADSPAPREHQTSSRHQRLRALEYKELGVNVARDAPRARASAAMSWQEWRRLRLLPK